MRAPEMRHRFAASHQAQCADDFDQLATILTARLVNVASIVMVAGAFALVMYGIGFTQ